MNTLRNQNIFILFLKNQHQFFKRRLCEPSQNSEGRFEFV
jgi:hypothetical protein